MNLPTVQREMQENRLWSLCPVQDFEIGADTFSLLCRDLYFRQFKETLKQTMLEQESVFEDQIHELHRLYQRQKDLMMEMDETNISYGQFLNAGVSISPRRSIHWMSSSISTSKSGVSPPPEDASAKIDEAGISGDESDDKSGEKVLDVELPSYDCLDIGEEEGSKNGEVLDFPKDQSPRRMSLESAVHPENMNHLNDLSKFILDLNEPAKIEEHSDYDVNQFPSQAQTRTERAEQGAQDQRKSTKSQAENGIDLNMSPLSCEEEVTILKTLESEQPRDFVSASLHEKHRSGPSRVIVQALPCLKNIPLFHNRSKSTTRSSWTPRKKAKRGAKSTKSQRGSNLDSNFGVNEDDDNHSLSTASYLPESDRKPGKRRRCKPEIQSGKLTRKIGRSKSKTSSGRFLVTEEENQEKSEAAEAIVDMSLSDSAGKSSIETSDYITPLLWFAKIVSSVVEDSKSQVELSVTGFHSDYDIDYFEAMTLQLTEMNPPEGQRSNTSVSSNTGPAKHKRTPRSQGKRQQQQQQQQQQGKDCDKEYLQSSSTITGNESSHDVNKIEKQMEVSETKDASCLMKDMVIDWGTIRKRRRGNRIPAANTNSFIAVWRNQSFFS